MSVTIHGKEYSTVAERVTEFHKDYPNGSIQTDLLHADDTIVRMKASIWPDVSDLTRCFTGHAEELRAASSINKTSALENAETSAVGRALAFAGYGGTETLASANEMDKVKRTEYVLAPPAKQAPVTKPPTNVSRGGAISDQTLHEIQALASKTGSKLDEIDAYALKEYGAIVPNLTEAEGILILGMLRRKETASGLMPKKS